MSDAPARHRLMAAGTEPDNAGDRLAATAREAFGWESLRPGQREVMEAVLAGRDALAVMPTGWGKSALYQLPALLIDGPTVVVSPLKALQHDQAGALRAHGRRAGGAVQVNSDTGAQERGQAFASVRRGRTEFLFLSPEQLEKPEVLEQVARAGPSLFVVDEAHCISSWGHDFRPAYLHLADAADAIGRPAVLALTATASPPVREDIVVRLRLRDPVVAVRGFDRPNLELAVEQYPDDASKREAVLERAAGLAKPGIVYTATRRSAEQYADQLAALGLRAAAFHGSLPQAQRHRVHEEFLADRLDVVVATSAFGMGVDKPNVRFVLHADVPESPDAYWQEVGRAGRDGEPATAILFYRPEDLGLRRFFTGGLPDLDDLQAVAAARAEHPDATRKSLADAAGMGPRKFGRLLNLLEDAGDPSAARALAEQQQRVERSRLEMMRGYAETRDCRRRFLFGYFGEPADDPCERCDRCHEGTAHEVRDRAADGAPFGVGERVEHDELGEGTVMALEKGRVVVLFAEQGYATLSLDVVRRRDLLHSAD